MAGQKQNPSPKDDILSKEFIQRTFKIEDI